MIMTDEKVINYLKEANLLGNNNEYFMGAILPNLKNQAMFGYFAGLFQDFSGYIINQTESGIGIIPLNNISGKPMINNACFLPQSNIMNVNIQKGGLFFYKKISITDTNNQTITFKVVKKVLTIKKHKENLRNFIMRYQ